MRLKNSLKKHTLLFFVFLILLILDIRNVSAQTYVHPYRWQVDTLIVVINTPYFYQFPQTHRIQTQTLEINRNNTPLKEDRDFVIKNKNQIYFYILSKGDSLHLQYKRLPFNFKESYRIYTAEPVKNDSSSQKQQPQVRIRRANIQNPFDNVNSGLQTSGSIMRGIQIGTNRDFTLNSGLNVELSGQLTENLEVAAALTDEATPIQPEGNTQTLNEVDKVFVNFKSPYVEGTVGDFNLQYKNSDFAELSRKLQGITLTGQYKRQQLNATVATTRGFFYHQTFLGQEGKQGPYQLTGKNGETDIIILAGTERIWINGEKMERGENNDYIIEYGNGQIRFTSKQLITSESRIEVDFEYYPASQKYNRNVYSALANTHWQNNNINLQLQFFRETDDPRQVLEEGDAVDDEEEEILKAAGDSAMQAYSDGATYLEDFSGNYLKLDTLWQNETYTYYKYVGTGYGDYSVRFSDVGSGNGSYVRTRLGVYSWVGPENGRYLPIRLLALPSRHDLADMRLNWRTSGHSYVNIEYAYSRLDQNILSGLDDNDNLGNAVQLNAGLEKKQLKWGKQNLGTFTFFVQSRFIENTFESADRFRQADYQRYWNDLDSDSESNEEKSLQTRMLYQPHKNVKISANAGRLQRQDFQSERYQALSNYQDKIRSFSAGYEYVGSDLETSQTNNTWQRISATAAHKIWKFDPQFTFKSEQRRNSKADVITGFRFQDYTMKLALYQLKNVEGFYEFSRRFDSVYDYEQADELLPQSTTTTQRITFKLLNNPNTTADIQLVRREKDFTSRFENIKVDSLKSLYSDASVQDTVWQDRTTDLAEINLARTAYKKAISASMQYRISSEQVALKEKVYLDVGEGRGNLRYDEDLKEYIPDSDGNYLLYILPSGKLEPVTTLQTAFKLRIDPSRYLKNSKKPVAKLLNQISSETYFRIEEETKETDLWSIYLLNLSKYQGDYTVSGRTQLNQDFHIMRRNRDLSFRLRFRYRKSRSNQYLSEDENEDNKTNESGLRANWRLFSRLKGQTEIRMRTVTRESAANSSRNRSIDGWYLNQNFSYRPANRWEIGLENEYGNEKNSSVSYPVKLWYGQFQPRLSYSLPENGRVSAQYSYQSVQLTDDPLNLNSIPYEMAGGKKEGVSQNWQARFEYTLAKNIVLSLFYSGRDEAGFENIIHSGQAEVRAYF